MSSSKTSKEARLHWEWVARIIESSKMSCIGPSKRAERGCQKAKGPKRLKKVSRPLWAGLAAAPPWSKARIALPHPLASIWFSKWASIALPFFVICSWIIPIQILITRCHLNGHGNLWRRQVAKIWVEMVMTVLCKSFLDDIMDILTWWVWWACEACMSKGGVGRWGLGAGRSQWRWLRSMCPSTRSWV